MCDRGGWFAGRYYILRLGGGERRARKIAPRVQRCGSPRRGLRAAMLHRRMARRASASSRRRWRRRASRSPPPWPHRPTRPPRTSPSRLGSLAALDPPCARPARPGRSQIGFKALNGISPRTATSSRQSRRIVSSFDRIRENPCAPGFRWAPASPTEVFCRRFAPSETTALADDAPPGANAALQAAHKAKKLSSDRLTVALSITN